jgi:hypothetical protein
VKHPPKLPDLSKLTDQQKEDLIVSLWETLSAMEGADEPWAPARPTTIPQPASSLTSSTSIDELRARLRSGAALRRARGPSRVSARLGVRLGFLRSRPLHVLAMIVALGFLADFGVGWLQQRALAARDQAELALRNAALGGLYVELTRIAYEPDAKSYRATMKMQRVNSAGPLYVMLNAARVFIQTGLTWQEAPSRAPAGASWGVVKLDGAHEYSVVFRADLADWSQLIPGYMHVLVQSDMLISDTSEPKDNLVERNNRFYVYLKPQGADDAWIKNQSNFAGDPPIFIPMPPH